jgi:hypothetical protein
MHRTRTPHCHREKNCIFFLRFRQPAWMIEQIWDNSEGLSLNKDKDVCLVVGVVDSSSSSSSSKLRSLELKEKLRYIGLQRYIGPILES